jgi:hypothetical protein
MPVLEAVDQRMSHSAVRHRPLGVSLAPEYQAGVARASRLRAHSPKAPTSKRPIPADDASIDEDLTDQIAWPQVTASRRASRTVHPFLLLFLGMLIMLLLWFALLHLMSWVQLTLDDLHYGRPRVSQLDAVVGHHDSLAHPTHLLAVNLGGATEFIEWPGGDVTKLKVYIGPQLFGPDANLAPVTLQAADVNSDHQPDVIMRVQSSQIVWVNEQGGFRSLHPGEHATLPSQQ